MFRGTYLTRSPCSASAATPRQLCHLRAAAVMEHFPPTRRAPSLETVSQSPDTGVQGLPRVPHSHSRSPLPGISESPFLLASPAPLDTTLSKSTGIGDIGLFSTRSVRSASTS